MNYYFIENILLSLLFSQLISSITFMDCTGIVWPVLLHSADHVLLRTNIVQQTNTETHTDTSKDIFTDYLHRQSPMHKLSHIHSLRQSHLHTKVFTYSHNPNKNTPLNNLNTNHSWIWHKNYCTNHPTTTPLKLNDSMVAFKSLRLTFIEHN